MEVGLGLLLQTCSVERLELLYQRLDKDFFLEGAAHSNFQNSGGANSLVNTKSPNPGGGHGPPGPPSYLGADLLLIGQPL